MANRKKGEIESNNAIENLNEQLTKAGGKLMERRKLLYWLVGGVVGVALIIAAWIFFYVNPENQKAMAAWQKVKIDQTIQNDTVRAGELKKVADQYGSRDGGNLAALDAAETYYRLGDNKKALECLEKFSTSEPQMKALAETMKGDCNVNLKQYAKAHECFAKALKAADNNPALTPYILTKEANVYDAEKNYQKALECYEIIAKDYPDFSMGNLSAEYYVEYYKAKAGK